MSFALPRSYSVAQATVSIAIDHKLSSRSAFQQSISGRQGGSLGRFGPVPLTKIESKEAPPSPDLKMFSFSFGVVSSGTPVQAGAVPILDLSPCPPSGCSGVYPIVVHIDGLPAAQPTSPLVTDLIFLQTSTATVPLDFSLVVSMSSNISNADTSAVASDLERFSGVPTTVAVTGRALGRLSASHGGSSSVSDLRSAVGAGIDQLVQTGYVPLDVSSLASSGLQSEISAQISRDRAVIQSNLRLSPEGSTWISGSALDRQGLLALRALDVSRLVVPDRDLQPVRSSLTVTHPWVLEGPDHYQPLVAPSDTGLEADVVSTSDPVLAAQRVLADLTQIWSDAPNQSSPPRGVVLSFPPGADPSPSFLSTLLAGLSRNPVIAPVTLASYFKHVPATSGEGRPELRGFVSPSHLPTLPVSSIKSLRAQVTSLATALRPEASPIRSIDSLILSSEAASLSGSRRRELLAQARATVSTVVSHVQLLGSRTITMTSSTGSLPIEVGATASYISEVAINVTSDKLEFPHPTANRCHPVPRGVTCPIALSSTSNTIELHVRARASGDFPLKVTVYTPEGGLALDSAVFTVRSTAFSGVAYGITAAALAFLALWWGRSIFRRRRAEGGTEGAEEADDGADSPKTGHHAGTTPSETQASP